MARRTDVIMFPPPPPKPPGPQRFGAIWNPPPRGEMVEETLKSNRANSGCAR